MLRDQFTMLLGGKGQAGQEVNGDSVRQPADGVGTAGSWEGAVPPTPSIGANTAHLGWQDFAGLCAILKHLSAAYENGNLEQEM